METFYAILGLCVLVALMFKAWQLWRLYGGRLRMRLEPLPPEPEGFAPRNPELPGKVRVIPRLQTETDAGEPEPERPLSLKERMSALLDEPPRPLQDEALAPAPQVVAELEPALVDLPLLQEQAEPEPLLIMPELAPTEPSLEPELESVMMPEPQTVAQAPAAAVQAPSSPPAREQQDMFAAEPVQPRAEPSLAARASALYEKEPLEPVNALGQAAEKASAPQEEVQDVVAVHVICRGVPFNGEDLLRAILSYGLRFGEMSIFHRHEQPTGQGRVLFSMAKAVEPGTFTLETMTGDFVPGVSFFQSLPGVNSILAYDIMIDTAKRLATELNGEVLDQQQNPMTRQLIEHYRERVMEFERRRLAARR